MNRYQQDDDFLSDLWVDERLSLIVNGDTTELSGFLEELSPVEQEIFRLKYKKELTLSQISIVVEKTPSEVEEILDEALEYLRDRVRECKDEEGGLSNEL